MADKPLVSVVIATYNMARYLPLALRSALDQTYGSVEVLVVDDGSQDETLEVMAPFLGDPRVRYLVQENRGQAAAKNHGIREAQGEYVAFLDADDMWELDKLEAQMPLFLQSEQVGVVCSDFWYVDEEGKPFRTSNHKLHRGWVSGPLLIFNFVGFGTSVAKRECFDRLGSFREHIRMGIDYDLWLRFSTQYKFDYVDRPLLHYRVWSGQMSRNWRDRYLSGIDIMKKFLLEFPGVVDQRTEDEAWAHTYVGFGQCMRSDGTETRAALNLYLKALRHKPSYLPAWKAIAAAILSV